PSSDQAGSAKYHQCGCMSRAMVSLAFRYFFGNGMNAYCSDSEWTAAGQLLPGSDSTSGRRIVSG
ncbi:MAG: hypothetical protein QOE00_1860, partial [Ilumatobacteraceae bacterium]